MVKFPVVLIVTVPFPLKGEIVTPVPAMIWVTATLLNPSIVLVSAAVEIKVEGTEER